MQIKIDLKIILFIIVFLLTKQIGMYSLIMLFVFIHEIGHLLCGILLGYIPKALNITPFGIGIVFQNYKSKENIHLKKILIALAGPMTNILIVILSNLLLSRNEFFNEVVYSNLLIAIFNMITIYPLDGGRILKSMVEMKYDKIIAEKISIKINKILIIIVTAISSIFVLYIKNIAIVFALCYLWTIVIIEHKKSKIKIRAYETIKIKN